MTSSTFLKCAVALAVMAWLVLAGGDFVRAGRLGFTAVAYAVSLGIVVLSCASMEAKKTAKSRVHKMRPAVLIMLAAFAALGMFRLVVEMFYLSREPWYAPGMLGVAVAFAVGGLAYVWTRKAPPDGGAA